MIGNGAIDIMEHRHKIVCTAGHIDHGKTALTKALTGMDTDRLSEEKRRGITIDLGFAFYGDDVTIIDLPGHERFIRNMVAGAATVDFAILVVAADDGPMPQTKEHLDILNLLNIRSGMTVITKTGLVEEDWADLVAEEMKELCRGTFLEGQPILKVDSISGDGIDHFKQVFDRELSKIAPRRTKPEFRLPIDRAFIIKGFGTVITGTVVSGKVKLKDGVQHQPSGKMVKVRGIQVHGNDVKSAGTGVRVALNLTGIEKSEIRRGDLLTEPGLFKPFSRYDCKITVLQEASILKHRQRLRFHIGTAEIIGRILLLEGNTLAPGESMFAQIELETPIVAIREDRFVFRNYSPQITMGGGNILTPAIEKHKRGRKQLIDFLRTIDLGEPSAIIQKIIDRSGGSGITLKQILSLGGLSKEDLDAPAEELLQEGKLIKQKSGGSDWFISSDALKEQEKLILKLINKYHRKYPERPGITLAEIRSIMRVNPDSPFIEYALQNLLEADKIQHIASYYSISGFEIRLEAGRKQIADSILNMISSTGLAPPKAHPIAEKLNVNPNEIIDLLAILESMGKIVRIERDNAISMDTFNKARNTLINTFGEQSFTLPQAAEALSAGRRNTVALLEYMDKAGYTERIGDERKIIYDY